MNGRVYDPQIGRFMSADPIVQDPTDTQSLNRYSYVSNNPLSYTDPTGYFSLGDLFKTIVAIVVVVVAVVFGQAWVGAALGIAEGTATAVIAGAIGGAIAGGITGGGDLQSILVGAVSGAAFAGLGQAGLQGFEKVAAYGTTGGVTSVMGGGNFQSGFLAAGFGALAGPRVEAFAEAAGDTASVAAGTAASAVAGGIGSVLGGGKFANGAVTGAFSYAVGRAMIGSPKSTDNACQVAGPGVCPMNDNELAPNYQITDAQREFAKNGEVEAFWRSRAASGDPIAKIGLGSLNPPGGIWDYLFGAGSINRRLQAYSRMYTHHELNMNEVRVDLMRAHVVAVDTDVLGAPGLLNPAQIATYHHQVFATYGLPPAAFGGTPGTGAIAEAGLTRSIWCSGCDH